MPYPMPDGRWRAEKMIGGRRKTKVCTSKAEAKRWEASQTGAAWEKERERVVTVFDWREAYLDYAQERFTDGTYHEKRRAFIQLKTTTPDNTDTRKIQQGDILTALADKARRVSGCRANRDRKNLAAAWAWGVKYLALPDKNPFASVDRFSEERSPRYVPPEADFWAAMRHAVDEGHRSFCLLMLYTAARRGELLRLQWQDVDIPGGRIRLHTRKRQGGTMEADWIPLASPAATILAAMPKHAMIVFPNHEGEQYSKRQHLLTGMCKRAGVKRFGFHAIRHLSASILAKEGVPLPIIQKILRHKHALTTSRYLNSLGLDLPEVERVWEGRENSVSHKILHMPKNV
jgi:integrase